MTQALEPNTAYDTAEAAQILGLSEEFLVGLIGRAVKHGQIKLQPGWKVLGSDLSRLGKVYHSQIESELHKQAYLRVQKRDDDELRERLDRSA